MRSIRSTLVLWLMSALVLGTAVVLAVTFILTRKEVGRLFDAELEQVAHAVHLREDWIQEGVRRVRIARPGFFLSVRAYDNEGRPFFETLFPTLPANLPHTFEEGFFTHHTPEGAWRVYTHVVDAGVVQVGQPLATRDALARGMSISVLMPMMVLIPLLVVLMAWLLTRGLAPLSETSRRVGHRDASRLDPLPTDNVPEELLPLVEQINALLGRLAGSLDAQRRFLADAAHELRSPVAALALQVQLAERAQQPEARAAAFRELARGVERARRLIQQLMDFARLEPGVQLEPFADVNLAGLARDVVGTYAARAEAQEVDLGADAPAAVMVRGLEPELRSLVENLVDNALRYAPRDSAVTVSVRQRGEEAELSVTDAGRGIPVAERERVFQRFHRVAGDVTSGTGLGLAIAKAIVERHRGIITLGDAFPGKPQPGLAVSIRLPVIKSGLSLRPAA